jgi:galactokinase
LRIVVSAPGRVCLFGEHMDWCGHCVIPAAIDARIYVEASPLPGSISEVRSFKPFQTKAFFNLRDIRIDPVSDLRYVGAVLKAMLLEERITSQDSSLIRFVKGKDLTKDVAATEVGRDYEDLPVKKGLSSSAALCVAVAVATDITARPPSSTGLISNSQKENFERTIEGNLVTYANLAYIAERKILGVNCGQMDQYASAYGGILSIDCSREPAKVDKLKMKRVIPIVIGDTNQQKDTPRILAWLGDRFKRKEKLFMEGIDGIARVVSDARKELDKESPNLEKVGELMNKNQQYLSRNLNVSGECPISPSNLDKLVNAALDGGAVGAKLTGSGGGGCVVALCESEGQRNPVRQAIKKAGGRAYSTSLATEGIRLELLEP